MALTSVTIVHNLERIQYPAIPFSIDSVLPVVEQAIIVNCGPHDDGTDALVREYALRNPKVVVINDKWPTIHSGLSLVTNTGLLASRTEWAFALQGDEIVPEWSLDALRELDALPRYIKAAKFNFTHYCGDRHHTFPFVYQSVVRACRRSSMYRAVGDAAEFAGVGAVYQSNVNIHHVGKMHTGRASAGALKEFEFQSKLYKDLFKTDPLVVEAHKSGEINYFKVFASAVERGEVSEYNGPWPAEMLKWLESLGA